MTHTNTKVTYSQHFPNFVTCGKKHNGYTVVYREEWKTILELVKLHVSYQEKNFLMYTQVHVYNIYTNFRKNP